MSPMVRLRPTARPVRRGAGEVQFGLSPGTGIVLAGLNDSEAELLLSLARTSGTGRDVSLSQRFGVPLERVEQLVATLRGHGLLIAPADAPSSEGHVVTVCGRGTVVDRLREELGSREIVELTAPDVEPGSGRTSLAVLCARDAIAPDEGLRWQRADTPHLPVVLRDEEAVIGPLVLPGCSPCLRCLDLHRRDRDSAWPRILTQLSCPPGELSQAVDAPPAQASVISSLVHLMALESLTSTSLTGVSWQVSLPWPDVRTRAWEQHPQCECTG